MLHLAMCASGGVGHVLDGRSGGGKEGADGGQDVGGKDEQEARRLERYRCRLQLAAGAEAAAVSFSRDQEDPSVQKALRGARNTGKRARRRSRG